MNISLKKNKKRIVSFPHMGNSYIPIKSLFESMGAKVLLPPYNNKEALSLGVRYSIETICLPYKMNLGNYIQALERGANTLVMYGAPGSCRLGHYATMAEATLKNLGYDFEMVIFNIYKGKLFEILKKFSYAADLNANILEVAYGFRLSISKFLNLDRIEKKLFYYRPREVQRGSAEAIYNQGVREIEKAKNIPEVHAAVNATYEKYSRIKIDPNRNIIRISITGEFFIVLDPFSNLEIERELGYLGVEVQREIMLADWISVKLVPPWLHKCECHTKRAMKVSSPYMTRIVGGDCVESIGDAVLASRTDVDGVIHLGPFNCTPETVSQCILPYISKNENVPVISLMVDEMTGRAGFLTRIEAFVDLVRRQVHKKLPVYNTF
ncbi:MAG: hypothetical protein A2Y25_07010 [Candidatus Melainabacteria bacterium GWF2_37_15]|nr:MAG: hypothetical protein A2Y25_07010 [Candidatus Melainabacteria bacterium GWF2_37_15]